MGLAFRAAGKYARLSLTLVQKNVYILRAEKRHYLTHYTKNARNELLS
jgi:hypothetical protein